MKMKFVLLIVLSSFTLNNSYAQYSNNKTGTTALFCNYKTLLKMFNKMHFAKVEAYAFNCHSMDYQLVDGDKNIAKSAIKKRILSVDEKNILLKVVKNKRNYISKLDMSAACYNPRMGFVFYDSANNIIAHLDICLECDQIAYENFTEGTYCQIDFFEIGIKNFTYLQSYLKLSCVG